MNPLLRAAQSIYTTVNGIRRQLYRRGVLRATRLPRPVVSIGNLSAGGAGKTPAVIALANALGSRGIKVAVLTRGYGRRSGSPEGLVTSLDTDRFGDEPVLIKKRTANVDVIVGRYRTINALAYLSVNHCDLFILDDGFQHLQIERDLDIVIDAPGSPFQRERRSALSQTTLVIPRRLTLHVPDALHGKAVFAFAGLADPGQFFDSLRLAGVDLRGTMPFPDHHRYDVADLARVRDAASRCGAETMVTTEKDAVKLEGHEIVAIAADFVFDSAVVERVAALVRT